MESQSLTKSDTNFLRGYWSYEGQRALLVHDNLQLATLKSLVGNGNPGHIDTTFGKAAYCTFVSFRNIRLVDVETGNNPTWFGPALIHSKEKDSYAIRNWLSQLRDVAPSLKPIFVTDQCSVLEKRLHEVWPDVQHVLGREHLIYNFNRQAQIQRVPEKERLLVKAALYGPLQSSVPFSHTVFDSNSVEEMDERFGLLVDYASKRMSHETCMILQWIKVRYI